MLPQEVHERVGPEHIAPAVVYMASDRCEQTGLIIQAGAGAYCRSILATNPAVRISDGSSVATLEQVAARWAEITDVSNIADAGNLSPQVLDPAKLLG